MGELSEWLNIMLGEVSRKQDDVVRAQHEQQLREANAPRASATPPDPPRETR
jgi:hypothetical protein